MWIERILGDLAGKKSYLDYKSRVKSLPPGYSETAEALERYLMNMGPSNDGKALVKMLEDLIDMLEQSVTDGTSIRALVGDDPSEFAEAFLENYAGGSWIRKERTRLAGSIDKAIGKEAS